MGTGLELMNKNDFMRVCREGGAAIEQALRALDRTYFATLYGICRRTLRDPDQARDLVQETFIKVWQRCATFQGQSELLPWIRSILRRNMLDAIRRRRDEVSIDESGSHGEEVMLKILDLSNQGVASPPDEVRRMQVEECFRRCWQRFEAAAPTHAAVIAWIAEDGLSNEDIATLLDRTPGATREFISQCRKRARQHLAEWYELALEKDPVA